MKYLQGKEYFDIKLMEREPGKPKGNEVLVRVSACGVCGSDVHMLAHAKEYVPLGHEISAVVEAVGGETHRIKPGDRVIVEDVTFCGVCDDCKNGNTHLCRNTYNLAGQSGMGEYLRVSEQSLIPYGDMDPVSACLTEPLAVALNAYFAAAMPPSGNIVIFGTGILGILCARIARHYGASGVVCVGSAPGSARNCAREAAAKQMGADFVLYGKTDDVAGKVQEYFGAKKADAVIVTSPPATLPQAMQTAGYGAKIVALGLDMHGGGEVMLDIDRLVFNKNSIVPVLAEPARFFPLGITLLQTKAVDAGLLVTHTFSIEEKDTLRDLYANDHPIIKAVMVNEN